MHVAVVRTYLLCHMFHATHFVHVKRVDAKVFAAMHQFQTDKVCFKCKAKILGVNASKQTLFFFTVLCPSLNCRQASQHTVQVIKPSMIELFHKTLQQEQM